MGEWIKVNERLPVQYRDVPVVLACGSQRVGRLNNNGVWLLASYQKCRHQYAGDVSMWFDTPAP